MIKSEWQKKRILASKKHQDLSFQIGLNGRNILARNKKEVVLDDHRSVIEFMSCSYLGLECDSRLALAAQNTTMRYGVQFAVARTRLKPVLFEQLESQLSRIFLGPTVTYSTVGQCHLALFPVLGSGELPSYPLTNSGPEWILDTTAHASIQILRALMAQSGPVTRINFQDSETLTNTFKRIYQEGKTPIAVGDGIGSMGGQTPVCLLFELAETFGGYCYLDDAHGTSIMGKSGSGYVLTELGTHFHPRLILASSLSKAFGATGGALTFFHSQDARFMSRYSTPYIFGGPLSLPGVAAALASSEIHLSSELCLLQSQLQKNLKIFDHLTQESALNAKQSIPLRGLLIGDELRCLDVGHKLLCEGFAVTTAMYPTVSKGQAMLRVALSSLHTEAHIKGLITAYHKHLASFN